jgi:alpha-tubulin suppressor-like RCC1 family protein
MPERSDFLQVDAEGLHTCAIGRGEIWCWGLNTSGELGIGEDGRVFTGLVTVPQQAARSVDTAGAPWTSVSNGAYHTCALLDDPSATRPQDDRLFCWGGNFSSQVLGIDTSPDFDTPPTEISSEHGFRLVEAGGSRTCAIRVVSHDPLVERLECWGSTAGVFVSGHGLGVGVPEPPAGTRWDTIDVAHAHTCGIRDDRSLWCWGSNEVGQLGSLSTELTSSAVPIRVCPP